MRKKIVAGNWKMNNNLNQAIDLTAQILSSKINTTTEIILIPSFPFLQLVAESCKNSMIKVGAQNCNKNEKGAFTGEVSCQMLNSVGVQYVLVGHSERRALFQESNKDLVEKVNSCLTNNINPIYCCGEHLEERNNNHHFETVKTQLVEGLFHLTDNQIKSTIIAYEPVWAIGTGVTATPSQAQEMHQFIRQLLNERYGESIAESLSILYGGSCNASNAKELFSLKDVDGGLIGGASLVAKDFIAIANSF